MFFITALFNKIKGLVNVDVSISFEGGSTLSIEAEISMEVVKRITENEAAYVWSDFLNCALPIECLEYSHTDTNGIPGYRIAKTNYFVWRDQLTSVAFEGGY